MKTYEWSFSSFGGYTFKHKYSLILIIYTLNKQVINNQAGYNTSFI